MCVCVKREHNVYPNPNMAINPNTKIKKIEYTHTIILNIKKIQIQIPKKEKKKNNEKENI